MAHYTFIKDNVVTEVIVGKDENDIDTLPDNFASWEDYYLTKRSDQDHCKRTSYNTFGNEHNDGGTAFRGNYAGIGFIYDQENDVFYPPQPFDSWTISIDTNWLWKPPIEMPTLTEEEINNNNFYSWDEEAYQADTNDPKTAGWILN